MRLIDADALDAEMYRKSFEVDDGRNVWNSGLWIRYKIFEEAIRDAPTVDAVPVIRCRECKHRPYRDGDGMIDGDYVCPYLCDDPWYTTMPEDDWFCHRAERKEE